jgi:hypothetical protein
MWIPHVVSEGMMTRLCPSVAVASLILIPTFEPVQQESSVSKKTV